jgi:hypothetical protein
VENLEWEEEVSRAHPLNSKIDDTDIFLHGTSMKKYLAIQKTGFLLGTIPMKNFSISQKGICFEKYVERGQYAGTDAKLLIDLTIDDYCKTACRGDQSKEGIVLQIKGRELKKLGCPIYADWNKPIPLIHDLEGLPIDVNYNSSVLSIIVVDCDIPLEYLEVARKVPFKLQTT